MLFNQLLMEVNDIWYQIFSYCTDEDIERLTLVNRYFYSHRGYFYKNCYVDYRRIKNFSFTERIEFFHGIVKLSSVDCILVLTPMIFKNLKCVVFDKNFNSDIHGLPHGITHLTFGTYFDKPIYDLVHRVSLIPHTVTHLTFGDRFNQPIKGLPKSVICLVFGHDFNGPVDGLLPTGLKKLVFDSKFNYPIDNLPSELEELTLGNFYTGQLNNLPKKLICFTMISISRLSTNLNSLPHSIKHLVLGVNPNIEMKNLPPNLTHLTIGKYHDIPIDCLPYSLVYLNLGIGCNNTIQHLPPNLKYLELDGEYNKSLPELPPGLTIKRRAKRELSTYEQWFSIIGMQPRSDYKGFGSNFVSSNYYDQSEN